MKYFITGATGFVGGRTAEILAERGHEVIALARNPAKAAGLTNKGITVVEGDITDKASMRAPMTGVDGVFHIAGWYKVGVRDTSMAVPINVDGTRNVLELMQELSIPRGVYTSTVGVFSNTHGQIKDETYNYTGGDFLNEYERTKWMAHYEVAEPMMEAGLPLVIAMPGGVYGPGDTGPFQDLIEQYLKRKLPAIPAGLTICWGHIDDTAEGHILAMEKGTPGQSYIIAGPPHPVTEYFDIAEKITGIPGPRIKIPTPVVKGMAALMGVVEKVFPVPANYSGEMLRTSAGVSYLGDNSKAKRELGYAPRSLEAGLRDFLPKEMDRLGIKPKT